MNAVTSLAAAAVATPYAADPVRTTRPQLDFADDRENPTKIVDPYVGRSLNPVAQLLGIPLLSEREIEAAQALGYDPFDAFLAFRDSSDVVAKHIDSEGFLNIDDKEELERVTGEVWAAFWHVDGNTPDPEDGSLNDTDVTLVRII